ncbi:hypothetical protein ARMSODRAFT_1028440 [Armillaria solidipes]|uniref:CxC2-like cysteine cluster KDZ transposase-associated domain-containing protein n=1 Tax=Armillaria solidipes TaxID=1076256 RepID=A0A2H3AGT3_9AGAR|nr:hypothetical protein ARMSODRAFT_1028440 [Armillaria solidipes]
MSYNPRKKGRRAPMDILDTTDDDNTAQIDINLPPTQEYHWHTDYSRPALSTTKRHTGRSAHVTMTHLPLGLASDNVLSTSTLSLEGLASSVQDGSLVANMSTLLFLDPDHEVPAEFALTSNESEGARLPRPMGDHPLLVWKSQHKEFLEESRANIAVYLALMVRCYVVHVSLSVIGVWNGSYFKRISLDDLGLIVQLGHKLGQTCLIPAVVHSFVVIDVDGIHTLQMGFWELALHCPACPHPHVNLPDGWSHNLQKRWLYCLFIVVNVNFRLRRLNVSDEINDPSLNQGYAYFVEEEGFKAHLETYSGVIPEEEKSTCNNHDAVKLTNSRGGKGAAATGVGAVVCGRHNMKRPLSIGDLQKSERYLNMDYFILSMLSYDTPSDLVISYDIACQWHKNFFARMEKYLASLRLHQSECNILYLVPKFHLPAHILSCCNNFSFNFLAKVGQTDGEAPEWGWAATNALANSMKEMGPGSRRDTLDDHFGDYNWRKIIIIVSTICERYKDAVATRAQHVAEFISYEDALQADHSTALHQWRMMVLAWESDRTQPNLFSPILLVTENTVRLELAQEEKTEKSIEIHHDVSPSEFIAQGLQLEEAQARLIDDIKELGTHSTDLQRTRIQQQTNCISRKIEAWIKIQKVYMPRTSLLRTQDDDWCAPGVEIHPTKIPLYLPSTALRLGAVDPSPTNTILNDERRLRLAQVHDMLATLCDHLLLKSYLTIWCQRFSRGQRYGTRANNLMHAVSTHLGRHEWKSGLFPLRNEDIRGLDSYDNITSEGHRSLSWIWKTNLQGGEEGLQEALRIEWCKSRARAQRWQEECELLTEEIRHVKVMFQFYNNVWNDRARKEFA